MATLWRPTISRAIVFAFGTLVVVGVGLAIAMDAGIIEPMPILRWVERFPLAPRLVVYVVVGVPVGIGIALYVLLEMADLAGFLTSRFPWRRRRSRT